MGLIKTVRFTLSLPFQTKEYNKVFISSFLFDMSVSLYKIFGKAKDLMICTFPINVSPLQPQPLKSFLIDFSVDLKFNFLKKWTVIGKVHPQDFQGLFDFSYF